MTKNLIKKPAFSKELYGYLKNDLNARLGRYHYDYPIIFIAGLPKSGTTWVETQLAKVPGYNLRPIYDPNAVTIDHDISDAVFAGLPKHGYTVIKLHTRYTPQNFEVIKRHVPRFMVMIRDLRDMCVSRYFHVKHSAEHRHHKLYNEKPLEFGIFHCLEVVEKEYVPWVQDWFRVAQANPEMILLVTYEALNQSTVATFQTIFDFFHLPKNDRLVKSLAASKLQNEQDLMDNLQKNIGALGSRSTARKGIVGDWQNYFSAAHKEKFKDFAGDILIELGYETNLNW